MDSSSTDHPHRTKRPKDGSDGGAALDPDPGHQQRWWDRTGIRQILAQHGYALPFPLLDLESQQMPAILDFLIPEELCSLAAAGTRLHRAVEDYAEGAVNRFIQTHKPDDTFLRRVDDKLRRLTLDTEDELEEENHEAEEKTETARYPHRLRYWAALRTALCRLGVPDLPVCCAIAVSPDSQRFAIAQSSSDGANTVVSVWDAASRRDLLRVPLDGRGERHATNTTLFLLDDRLIFCCCSHIRVWRLGKGAGALLLHYNLPPHAADPILPKFVYYEGFVLCVTDQDSVDAYQIMESERHFPNVLGTTLPNIKGMFVVNSHWLIVHGISHHETYSLSDVYQFDLRGSPWLVDQPLPYYRHRSDYGEYDCVAPCPGVLLDGIIAYSVCATGYVIVKIFQIHDSSHSTESWRKHGWIHLKVGETVCNNSCGRQILCPVAWTPYCRAHRWLDGRLERILECPGGIMHEDVMAHVGAKNDILLVGMDTLGRRFPRDGGLPLALFSARNSCM